MVRILESGRYTIVNVMQSNVAYLSDHNDGTPVAGYFPQGNTKERVTLSLIDS